jgi:hypothetical protein
MTCEDPNAAAVQSILGAISEATAKPMYSIDGVDGAEA